MDVGFVGLGAMGGPMAANILRGDHMLTVYDTNPDAVSVLRDAGANVADSCASLARVSKLLITMLPRPADVESVMLGDGGIAEAIEPDSVVVDMSTGDPDSARRMAQSLDERGIGFIDCPVGRTQVHAESGTLLLLAGGDRDAILSAKPVLDRVGSDLVHCGGIGTGQAMKLVNNMLATIALQGVAEALSLGLAAGLSLETIQTVTKQTMAQTAQLDVALPNKTFGGDLEPGFTLSLAQKDVSFATALAERLGVAVPVAQRTLECCAELVATGHGGRDIGIMVAENAPGILPSHNVEGFGEAVAEPHRK